LILQIESAKALDNLEAIAAVDGVDAVFVGPGDLSTSLGYLGRQGHPDVVGIIEKTIARGVAAGTAVGILTGDETLARRYIAAGTAFTAVGSDMTLLARSSEQLAAKFRASA
jgi:4-hydroxy-2-oxoheptanedioate aldolase